VERVSVFAMAMIRSLVRRELIIRAVAKEVLDSYEMDWLALVVALECGIWRYVGEDSSLIERRKSECKNEGNGLRSREDPPSYNWTIATGRKNHAQRGSWATTCGLGLDVG